jgi:type II secretory pathway component PulM
MNDFLWGALAMASVAIAAFFARFWRESRDRLFLFFFLAFLFLALNWIGLAVVPRESESRHQVFVLRLVAFGLIIAGIVDKNRRGRAKRPSSS